LFLDKLYGVNRSGEIIATDTEKKDAQEIIESFEFRRKNRVPGEENDVLREVLSIFKCEKYITILADAEPAKRPQQKATPEQKEEGEKLLKKAMDSDTGDLISYTSEQKERERKFQESHKDGEDPMITMMMSMYMLGAMEYFDNLTLKDIKQIAFRIAWMGTNGIKPDEKGYRIEGVDKEFSGYQLLAWYYVSWAIAVPEELSHLNLPFAKAYETAKLMYDKKYDKQ
jgi:hypothetical protein